MSDTESNDGETTSTQTRWPYTNDLVAAGYLLAFVVLVGLGGYGSVDLTAVPVNWRLGVVTIALVAAAWTFGTAAFKAVMDHRS